MLKMVAEWIQGSLLNVSLINKRPRCSNYKGDSRYTVIVWKGCIVTLIDTEDGARNFFLFEAIYVYGIYFNELLQKSQVRYSIVLTPDSEALYDLSATSPS